LIIYQILQNVSIEEEPATVEITVMDSVEIVQPEPTLLYGIQVDSFNIIQSKVKRNENLSEILSRYNVGHEAIYHLAKASREVFDVRKIGYRKPYTIISAKDSLSTAKYLIYEPSLVDYVVFDLGDSINVTKHQKEITTIEKELSGVIDQSLAVSMDELGANPQLTNEFADIFAWQIDFFRLFPGDKFKLIYEEQQVEGEFVGLGKIKGAYFEHYGNPYYAINYEQKSGIEYFDPEGKSLRKALLKYPVEFTRISSRYTGRRFHPVQKRYKAHLGTDFAAPTGTPIRSVGDGIILEARYGKYNGNYVKVKHNGIYSTQYLHMSRIAKGVRPGTKVKQGQVIGYVGSTGLARGSHLCFRFWKNGVQVDALKVDLPASEPISEENLEEYNILKASVIRQLDDIPFNDPDKKLLARNR